MSKIYRTDGLYLTHVRSQASFNHRNNYIYICIFFIENYMCFEWEPVDDPVIVNSGYLSHMSNWRREIFKAIRSGEIEQPEAKHKFAKYIEKPNGCIEARFRDDEDSIGYKDIILIPKLFGGVSLILNTYAMHYDIYIPEDTGYKEKRLINMETLKFYKY